MSKAKSILDILRDASTFEGWHNTTPAEHVREFLEDSELDGLGNPGGCSCSFGRHSLMACDVPLLGRCRVGVYKPCPGLVACPSDCDKPGAADCCIGPKEEEA